MSGLSSSTGGTGRGARERRTSDVPAPAEQHLGDRLAALVDGELGHDQRERVLAHLATCRDCRTEADAQRSLKNVFAGAAPPPPSEGLLARLQQLPGDGLPGPPMPEEGPVPGGSPPGPGWPSGHLPGGRGRSLIAPDRGGFRIHTPERSASSRSRRFAVAAAGAVSLAALTLGGTFASGGSGSGAVAAGGDPGHGSSVGQTRAASSGSGGSGSDRDGRRRSQGGGTGDGRAAARSSEQAEAGQPPGTVLAAQGGSGRETAGAVIRAARAAESGGPASAVAGPAVSSPRAAHPYPLLRDEVFAPSLTRSALPSVTYPSGRPGAVRGGEQRSPVAQELPVAAPDLSAPLRP